MTRLTSQRDLLNAVDEQCRSIRVRVTSGDGSVSVEVDALGAMTGLWLGDAAYRQGARALAALIVDVARAAAQQVADRQNYLLAEFTQRMTSA